MRAKLPSKEGFAERDGVKIHYEVYGDGPQRMVFLPPFRCFFGMTRCSFLASATTATPFTRTRPTSLPRQSVAASRSRHHSSHIRSLVMRTRR